MRRLLLNTWSLFAIALLLGTSEGRGQTWIQWKSADGGNNHYYAITPTPTNWDAAQKLAVSWGGTLATITSSNEQNFINTTFLTGKFEHLPLWIGLRNLGSKGGFNLGPHRVQFRPPRDDLRWVTGEEFSYTNWKPGEPNRSSFEEDYVTINWEYSDVSRGGRKGNWNDTPLDGTSGYGGKTDGPYFGLVEREGDLSKPVKAGFNWPAGWGALVVVFGGLFIFCFARRFRKSKKSES